MRWEAGDLRGIGVDAFVTECSEAECDGYDHCESQGECPSDCGFVGPGGLEVPYDEQDADDGGDFDQDVESADDLPS